MFFRKKISQDEHLPAGITIGMHITGGEVTRPLYYIIRSFIAAAGIFGTLLCFLTACGTVSGVYLPSPGILAAAFIGWLYFSAAFSISEKYPSLSGNLASIAIIVLMIYGILRMQYISAGLMNQANEFLAALYYKYEETPLFYVVPEVEGRFGTKNIHDCTDEAFVLLSLLISAVTCRGTVKRPNILLVLGATFPLAELCLYNGLVPNYGAFGLLICSWGGALAAEITAFGAFADKSAGTIFTKTSAQSACAAAVMMLISFCGALVFSIGFVRPESADAFRAGFVQYMSDFSWQKLFEDLGDTFLPSKSKSVTHDGKLGNVERVEFSGKNMLEATIPEDSGNMYLKGFTATEYTGSRWNEGPALPSLETKLTSPEFFSGRTLKYIPDYTELAARRVIIRNVGAAADQKYYPVNSAGLLAIDGTRRTYGVYFPEDDGWRRNIIDSAGSIALPGEMYSDEIRLRTYAYTYCLDVPETFTAAADFFDDYEGTDIFDELMYIRTRLAEECEYNLEAGKKPFGADFAQWFLTDNRKGSCTHFATAAALLCRSRGIPARYCEGFVIKDEDIEDFEAHDGYVTVSVPDSRAHAWIEVYVDGYGWLSFEVTPGYGNVMVEYVYSDPDSGNTGTSTSVITTVTTQEPFYSEDHSETTVTFTAAVSETATATEETTVTFDDSAEETAATTSDSTAEVTTAVPDENGGEVSGGGTSPQGGNTPQGENSGENDPHGGNTPQGAAGNSGGNGSGSGNDENSGEAGAAAGNDGSMGNNDDGTDEIDIPPDNIPPESAESTAENNTTAADDDNEESEQPEKAIDPGVMKALLKILGAMAAIAAVVGAVYGRRRLIFVLRRRKIKQDPVRAASELYGMLSRLAVKNGVRLTAAADKQAKQLGESGLFDEELCAVIINTALLGRFGGGVSPEEAESSAQAYERLVSELGERSGLEKAMSIIIYCSDKYI